MMTRLGGSEVILPSAARLRAPQARREVIWNRQKRRPSLVNDAIDPVDYGGLLKLVKCLPSRWTSGGDLVAVAGFKDAPGSRSAMASLIATHWTSA
jgi:hypothetical protein